MSPVQDFLDLPKGALLKSWGGLNWFPAGDYVEFGVRVTAIAAYCGQRLWDSYSRLRPRRGGSGWSAFYSEISPVSRLEYFMQTN
jgi:hypothetical protein